MRVDRRADEQHLNEDYLREPQTTQNLEAIRRKLESEANLME
jgi:hypothetical protein